MDSQQEQYSLLVKAILPQELFQYFELTEVQVRDLGIDIYLDEKANIPSAYTNVKLTSKGFHPAVTFQDFPIRDRAVFLHVRRRKWQVGHTGRIISNSFDLMAEGTRYTKGFASFLKGLFGQIPDQQQ